MEEKFLYFDVDHAVKVHDWIIEKSGGRAGINDLNLLHSPLEHIQNEDYYPSLEEKLTHLIFSINKHHAFVDGNKRSSIALGAYFLELNGYEYCIQYFVQEMENIAVWVADNLIDKELLHHIIVALIYEDDYPEWLKLSITHAISHQND